MIAPAIFRCTSLLLAALALASFTTDAVAQEEQHLVTKPCGTGVLELCGEVTQLRCEYAYHVRGLPIFPYVIAYRSASCETLSSSNLYRDALRDEVQDGSSSVYDEANER